ncbi:MAG: DUF86 domain-containing protein [Planctomycetaceae bacterium]
MSPERDDRAYLWDMLTAPRAVVSFVQGRTLEDYLGGLLLRSAVERQVEIIGEAARRVSREFQVAHPEIPWRPVQARRHILAHDYGEIRHDRLWRVAIEHVPALIKLLDGLVPQEP